MLWVYDRSGSSVEFTSAFLYMVLAPTDSWCRGETGTTARRSSVCSCSPPSVFRDRGSGPPEGSVIT